MRVPREALGTALAIRDRQETGDVGVWVREAVHSATKADKTGPLARGIVRLTRETEYALRGLCVLAGKAPGATVPLMKVAAAQRLPPTFLAKIFQKLARHGILRAARGAGRGYALASAPEEISVLEVIEAIEGSDYLDRCLFWTGRCGEANPCVLHEHWLTVRPRVRALLESTTLADLARDATA